MTEAEWQRWVNAEPMLRGLHASFGGEKMRLFGCVVYRRVWEQLGDEFRSLIDATEAWVLSAINFDQWQAVWDRYRRYNRGDSFDDADVVRSLVTSTYGYVLSAVWRAAYRSRQYSMSRVSTDLHMERDRAEKRWQSVALRDLFGNPFRPVAFAPAWRTDTAVSLARQMYESREFGAMPILADALQDAGCDNDDILTHCRDAAQVHVRGCWVCDLVLGKA